MTANNLHIARFLRGFLGVCLLSFLCTGCFGHTRYSTTLPDESVQSTYGDIALEGDALDKWWEAFGDENLNEFVEIVLRESPTLQSAYLKLLDSEYSLKQTESGFYPSLSFSAGVGAGGSIYQDPSAKPSYNLGLSASYELDIWGKVSAQQYISQLSLESSRDSAESAAMTLVANVATEWFNIKYYRERKAINELLLNIAGEYYELVQKYYRLGQTNGMDVLEQKQQIENLKSNIRELETRIRQSQHALEILAGNKATPTVEGHLPKDVKMGGTPDVDTLLKNRPDVRMARRSAEQANAQVVIALADRLPSLRLSASLSYRSADIVELFKNLLWDVGASLTVPLFDGFNKAMVHDRAKISYLSQRFSYAVTVMEAIAEVEKSILNLKLREQLLEDAHAQLERQKEILELSRQYFTGGTIDYSRVLSALRSLISSFQSEVEARHALIDAQIALCKSTGGSDWLQEMSDQNLQKARDLLEKLDNEK